MRHSRPESPRKARRWIATLGMGLLLSGLSLQAHADTAIYFYSGSGVIDVSASYTYQQNVLFDGYQQNVLFDSADNIVAIVDSAYNIRDVQTGELLGYVAGAPPTGGP